MKKSAKIIVPFLLVLLILFTVVWYALSYDRDFTRDMMLKQARLFSDNGNQGIASWFYDLAYNFSDQDEDVAIELANQFKEEGNYTKAEYTLSNAIADGGTAELYIALCKTYVEQNKLLDAVTMLDNVKDPAIKAQLDALRPAAPASDPAPGFYSQYIPVSMKFSGGMLYYTTDGEYPSIDDVPYSEPITLPAGETAIYAVTVADSGLVSPLSILSFTVGGVIEEVTIEEPAIDTAIRDILGLSQDEPIFSNQLWTITDFTVPAGTQNLNDLSKLTYLESLTIPDTKLNSMQFLSGLVYLTELDLTGCRFSSEDLKVIASLPLLSQLNLSNCALSTIAGLENATHLSVLNISDNAVRNLEPLTNLTGLRELYLQHNAVTNLNALSGLTNLEKVNLSYNSITTIVPLVTCAKITELDVSNNGLTSLSGIDKLTALTYFNAIQNQLADISLIANCTELVELHLARNAITDVSALSALVNLVTLDISRNQITALPAFPDDAVLGTIDACYNQITSLKPLANQVRLGHIYMDYNQITSIQPLENCRNLIMINIYGNAITEGVEELLAQDIIVNYDPSYALTE